MKKFIIAIIFCLAVCSLAFAQSNFPELEKIKQIKLLESTRDDVKRIFREYAEDTETYTDEYIDSEDDDIENVQFSTENMTVRIFYSHGDCSGEDSDEEWNVPKGKVTEIFVLLEDSVKPKDLKVNLSNLERLKLDDEDDDEDDDLLYYDKDKGISYRVSDGKIEHIKFIPSEKSYPLLCNNENVRRFNSDKEWFRGKIREFWVCYLPRPIANVTELNLSKSEVTSDCPINDSTKAESDDYFKIAIQTKGESSDPTDVLTYNYTVSGGKITGNGANVIWDLSGVKPGRYTITAGVDNGCGVCGTTKTQEVIIKEPFCPQK